MPRIFITSGTSYTLPADFNPNNNTVECYGSGGVANNFGGYGGGGGAYAKSTNVNIGAGVTVNIHIGSAGATDTWFNATSLANAVSNGTGISCGAQGGVGNAAGTAASSCGSTKFSGGTGGAGGGSTSGGGGGGGAAGPNGNGANGGVGGVAYNHGGGGGGANNGSNGVDGGATPSNGGNGRGGTGGGVYSGGSATANLGGGGAGSAGQTAPGGNGALDDVYGDGVHGPGGGGGGGGYEVNPVGGGNAGGYGGGGGGSASSTTTGSRTNGLIVITYVSVSPGVVENIIPVLALRPPSIIQAREVRAAELAPPRMDWHRQSPDLLVPPHRKHLFRPVLMPQREAPNPTPLYKPPWLQWPELLRHPVAGLDYRQQFPGKKPIDFFATILEGPDTVASGFVNVNSPITADLYDSDVVTSIIQPAPELGGADDIIRRVKSLLPKGWWFNIAPIRDAIIGGIADVSAWSYSLVQYAKKQTRVAWATDIWLDILSKDYFRFELPRKVNESDDKFRLRIQEELIRERVTRAGMTKALNDLTGKHSVIFEPWNTGDTGAWDVGTFAWDISGGWGDYLPAQAFINVIPPGAGIPGAPGWDIASGWDSGGTMWGDMTLIEGSVTDADIYRTINRTRPTGSIMWTQLSAPQSPLPLPVEKVRTPSFAPPGVIPLVVQPGPQRYSIPVMPDSV